MIKVTGCRILIQPFALQEHDKVFASAKKAGIELPEFSQRKEEVNVDKGTVLQIGTKCHEDYIDDLKVGDVVGYAKFGGKFIQDPADDKVYLVVNDEDIVCIMRGESNE
jgi:co-chaperonin GroES (HSP10)